MQMLLVLLVRSWRDAWIYTIDGRGIGWLSESRHARTSRDMVLLFSARAVSMLPVHVLYIVLSAQRSAAQRHSAPLNWTLRGGLGSTRVQPGRRSEETAQSRDGVEAGVNKVGGTSNLTVPSWDQRLDKYDG